MQAAPRNQARLSDTLSDNFKNSNSVTGDYTDTVKIQFKNIAQHSVHKMKLSKILVTLICCIYQHIIYIIM